MANTSEVSMNSNPFQSSQPNIDGNLCLRTPQREGYEALRQFAQSSGNEREVGLVLPVGCGKSGLITICPFAFRSSRVLVIAPNVKIAEQLGNDFDPTSASMFYQKYGVLSGAPYPEFAEIRGDNTNISDLQDADVIITNIQQVQGTENRWLEALSKDFFDLILVDEGHHNVADSWEILRKHFPNATIVNFTATPARADGQMMQGRIIYTYPVFRAIQEGYVKRLKAIVLNPRTLRYVRREDDVDVQVDLDEVRRLGEEDADFRRSIVTSEETLNTIMDASIREVERIRIESGDKRHKIIASALNYKHCIQIVKAYRARGLRAAYVHSLEDSKTNQRVHESLDNHQLDVIVQVRKLGEGFDHPYLSVAAVFSIFRNLSPFVQFVGRIMRVVDQNSPDSPNNQGVVVFHAGANVARRWEDFRQYSEADQEFFDQLLPMEGLDFSKGDEIRLEPASSNFVNPVMISGQTQVTLEEIPLLEQDEELRCAAQLLSSRGVTAEQYRTFTELRPVPTTRQRRRRAARSALDDQIRNTVGQILKRRRSNPQGKELDHQYRGRSNLVVLKSTIDRKVNEFVGRSSGQRAKFTRDELDRIEPELERLATEAEQEV